VIETNTIIHNADKYQTDDYNNIFKNNFSEAFFQNIYEKLRENLQNGHNNPYKKDTNQYPILLDNNIKPPNTESLEKKIIKEDDKASNKSANISPNPYFDDLQKMPLAHFNRDEKLNLYKNPSFTHEIGSGANSAFLGRKTTKNNKENNSTSCNFANSVSNNSNSNNTNSNNSNSNTNNNNEIFKISKQNSGTSMNNFNITNEEEDIRKYLECNEKNEEANKMSFDSNFLIDEENLFDFNNTNNVNNNVNMNMNSNIIQCHDKEFN